MEFKNKEVKSKTIKIIVISVVVIFILLIAGFSSFTVVDAGHTGVKVNLGKVSDNVLNEGLHLKMPFITKGYSNR